MLTQAYSKPLLPPARGASYVNLGPRYPARPVRVNSAIGQGFLDLLTQQTPCFRASNSDLRPCVSLPGPFSQVALWAGFSWS